MRKVFSMAFIAILSLTVIFYSCQKEIKTPKFNSEYAKDQIVTYYNSLEIQKLDKKSNFVPGKKDRKLTKKQAAVIIVSDVSGGWKGVELGAKAGGFLGGNVVFGGLAGGVIGAVVSSGFTWWATTGCSQPGFYPTSNNGLNNETSTFCSGYNNQFEQVGFLHNKYCKEIFKVGSSNPLEFDSFANQVLLQYCNSIESDLNLNIGFVNSNHIAELKQNSFNASQIKSFAEAKIFFETNTVDMVSTTIILNVIERLFQIDENNNYDIIFLYANEYINLVTNDPNLNESQKQKLLIALNILNYSAALWKNN